MTKDNLPYEVFISYRREGGVDYARMIYLELKGRGYRTFFDFNSLRSGRFNEGIFAAIDQCRYFLLVLSDGALDRCANADDWVRQEIEYALARGKEIIPVCPSGNVRGFPEALPPSLEPLRAIQISVLQMEDLFDKSIDKIIEDRFAEDFRGERTPVSVASSSHLRFLRWILVGLMGLALAYALLTVFALVSGSHSDPSRMLEAQRRIAAAEAQPEIEKVKKNLDTMLADIGKTTDAVVDEVTREGEENKLRGQLAACTNALAQAKCLAEVKERRLALTFYYQLFSTAADYRVEESELQAALGYLAEHAAVQKVRTAAKAHLKRLQDLD